MGLTDDQWILLSQSYNSYYSCFIQLANDYSYCLLGTLLAKVKGKLVQDDINRYMNNSISCQEAKITKTKYENLQPEIAKNSSRMWETIGLIQVLFPDVPVKIDELINQIKEIDKKFADLEMKIKSDEKIKLNFVDEFEEKYSGAIVPQERDLNNWSKEKLKVIENWSDEKESNLKVLIDELEKPIDHLLDEMLKVLKDERSVPDVMGGHPIIF